MHKYRFVVEMMDGRTYAIRAFSQREAEVLVHAYCILMGLKYDWDFTTCEQRGVAGRWVADKSQFDKEWNNAAGVTLTVVEV